MLITQKRAIERRIAMRDASYKEIAREFGIYPSYVGYTAAEMGHKRAVINHLRFMVRAQNALLKIQEVTNSLGSTRRRAPHQEGQGQGGRGSRMGGSGEQCAGAHPR